MLVRYRISITAALLLTACDEVPKGAPTPPATESASVSQAPSEEAMRLARAAADAALAAAKTCIVTAPSFDDAADACPVTETEVNALSSAANALGTFVKEHDKGTPAAVKAFSTVARNFAEWVSHGHKYGRTRGTLRLFQDVADAFNALRPQSPLPIDPVEEYRLMGYGSKGYIMKPMKKTDGRVVWKSCYDGPCLWENHY